MVMNREILANRYEIQQRLGKKAGRSTFLATDVVTGKSVIVKLLAFSSDFEWDDLKLFEREAQTLKSLSHSQIPAYLDYFEVNSAKYQGFALVQTYIPAQTLEQYLQTGRKFTEIEVKEIASSVLEILIYLHNLNPPGDRGKAGSRVSLERGGKPTRAVLTAANILDHDTGH